MVVVSSCREMFHFPTFPPPGLCVQPGVTRHVVRGFPIRKSWSQRPVIDSTRLIADSHVLLRLLMPRHPPCALKNLTTKIKNISRKPGPNTHAPSPERKDHASTRNQIYLRNCFFLRCSRPLCSSQPTTPTHPHPPQPRGQARHAQENQKQPNPHPPAPHPPPDTPPGTSHPHTPKRIQTTTQGHAHQRTQHHDR